MARTSTNLGNMTVKKLEDAIKSFKGQKTGASKSTQNTLDSLIKQYTNYKNKIILLYNSNVNKNINLKGVDKSLLSMNKILTILRGKDVQKITNLQMNVGELLTSKGTLIGLGVTTGLLTTGRLIEQLGGSGAWEAIGTAFTDHIFPAIGKALGFTSEMSALQGWLAGGALAGGVLLVAGLVARKLMQKHKQKVMAESAMQDELDKDVKSKQTESFQAGKFNREDIVQEILNDPSLRDHLTAIVQNGDDTMYPPVVKGNIQAALDEAERQQNIIKGNNFKSKANGLISKLPADKKGLVSDYVTKQIEVEELEEIDNLYKQVKANPSPSDTAPDISGLISTLTPGDKGVVTAAFNNAWQLNVNAIKAAIASNPETAYASIAMSGVGSIPGPGTLKTNLNNFLKNSTKNYFDQYVANKKANDAYVSKRNAYNASHDGSEIDETNPNKTAAYKLDDGTGKGARDDRKKAFDAIITELSTNDATKDDWNKIVTEAGKLLPVVSQGEIETALKEGTLKQLVEAQKTAGRSMS